MPLGFWDFTKVGKGRKRAMGLRTSRSGGERGWTCPHTLCWMETGEASAELETPASWGSWVGGESLITGIRPSPPATAGPLYHWLSLVVLWSNTAVNVRARRDPAPLGSLWWAVLHLCSASEVILEGHGCGMMCKVTLWSTSLSPGASH